MTRLVARIRRDDRGFTLVELLVSTGILGVVMILVTGAVLLASGTSARVGATGAAQQQAHQAFDSLDRQVRWASAFSTPGTAGGNVYVEWLYLAGGTPTCQQLQLDTVTHRLRQRSWPQGTVTAATGWRVVASDVAATTPFTVTTADSTSPLQRLRIVLTATAGGAKSRDTATHDVTYPALNSAGSTATTTACSGGRTS